MKTESRSSESSCQSHPGFKSTLYHSTMGSCKKKTLNCSIMIYFEEELKRFFFVVIRHEKKTAEKVFHCKSAHSSSNFPHYGDWWITKRVERLYATKRYRLKLKALKKIQLCPLNVHPLAHSTLHHPSIVHLSSHQTSMSRPSIHLSIHPPVCLSINL